MEQCKQYIAIYRPNENEINTVPRPVTQPGYIVIFVKSLFSVDLQSMRVDLENNGSEYPVITGIIFVKKARITTF